MLGQLTRKEALECGSKFYFTANCSRRHGQETVSVKRSTATSRCVECVREDESEAFYKQTGERLLGFSLKIYPEVVHQALDLINALNDDYRRTYDNTK